MGLKKTRQVITHVFFDAPSESATEYNFFQGGYTWDTSRIARQQLIPTNGIFTDFYIRLPQAETGVTHTVSVSVNSVDVVTMLVGVGGDNGTVAYDRSEIRVQQGDTIAIKGIHGGPGNTSYFQPRFTCFFIPDIPGETILMGSSANATDANNTELTRLFANYIAWDPTFTYTQRHILAPTNGTLKKFGVKLSTDPGTSPNQYEFGVYEMTTAGTSSTVTDLTIALTESNYSGDFNNTDEIPITKGDFYAIGYVPTSTPGTSWAQCWGMVFVPDIPGESWIGGVTGNNLSNSTTEYNYLMGGGDWTTSRNQRYTSYQDSYLKNLLVALVADSGVYAGPGAGTYTFTVEEDSGDSELSLVITSGNYTAPVEDTGYVDINALHVMNIQCTPATTPTVRDALWAVTVYFPPVYELDLDEEAILGDYEPTALDLDASFEDGTLDEFTGTTTNSGDEIYASARHSSRGNVAALSLSGGDGSNKAELDYTISASEVWIAFDFLFQDTVNLPSNGIHALLDVPYSVGGATNALRISMTDIGGGERIGFSYRDNGAYTIDNDNTYNWEEDIWYRLHAHVKIDGADGEVDYTLDTLQVKDNMGNVGVGGGTATSAGYLYFNEDSGDDEFTETVRVEKIEAILTQNGGGGTVDIYIGEKDGTEFTFDNSGAPIVELSKDSKGTGLVTWTAPEDFKAFWVSSGKRLGIYVPADSAFIVDREDGVGTYGYTATDPPYSIPLTITTSGTARRVEFKATGWRWTGGVQVDSDSATGLDNNNDGATIEQVQIGNCYSGWTSEEWMYIDNVKISATLDPYAESDGSAVLVPDHILGQEEFQELLQEYIALMGGVVDNEIIVYDDDETNWNITGWGTGGAIDQATATIAEDTGIKYSGTSSAKSYAPDAGDSLHLVSHYTPSSPIDISGATHMGVWIYGSNSGKNISIYMYSPDGNSNRSWSQPWTDDFTGWKYHEIETGSHTNSGGVENVWKKSNIYRIAFVIVSAEPGQTIYYDRLTFFSRSLVKDIFKPIRDSVHLLTDNNIPSLVLHAPLNEGEGTIIKDRALGAIGTLGAGAPWVTSNDRGEVISWEDGNDVLTFTDRAEYGVSNISISAWCWAKDDKILVEDMHITRRDLCWAFGVSQSGKIAAWVYAGGGWRGSWFAGAGGTDVTSDTETWNHIGMVWRDDRYLDFYLNGELDRTEDTGGTYSPINDPNNNITINRGTSEYWSGYMQDVRIHDAELTAVDFKALYNGGVMTKDWTVKRVLEELGAEGANLIQSLTKDWSAIREFVDTMKVGYPTDIIVDNLDDVDYVGIDDAWGSSTSTPGYYGTNYSPNIAGTGNDTATFNIVVPESGDYEVWEHHTGSVNRATDAPFTIYHAGGEDTVDINQEQATGWYSLGTYRFEKGTAQVMLTDNANQYVIADAIKFVPKSAILSKDWSAVRELVEGYDGNIIMGEDNRYDDDTEEDIKEGAWGSVFNPPKSGHLKSITARMDSNTEFEYEFESPAYVDEGESYVLCVIAEPNGSFYCNLEGTTGGGIAQGRYLDMYWDDWSPDGDYPPSEEEPIDFEGPNDTVFTIYANYYGGMHVTDIPTKNLSIQKILEELGAEGANLTQTFAKDWSAVREFAETGLSYIGETDDPDGGGLNVPRNIEDIIAGSLFEAPKSGYIRSIYAYIVADSSATSRAAIYDTSFNFVKQTQPRQVSGTGWFKYVFNDNVETDVHSPYLTEGESYYLVVWSSGETGDIELHGTSDGDPIQGKTATGEGPFGEGSEGQFPSSVTFDVTDDTIFSIYGVYAGGALTTADTYTYARGAIYRTLSELGDGINLGNLLLKDSDRIRDFAELFELNKDLTDAQTLTWSRGAIYRTLEELGAEGANLTQTLTKAAVYPRILEEFDADGANLTGSMIFDKTFLRTLEEFGAEGANLTGTIIRDFTVLRTIYEKAGLVSPESSVVARYDFEENQGIIVKDTSGNEKHGTFQSGTVWDSGKNGRGMTISGGNGVAIPKPITDQTIFDQEWSILGWVNITDDGATQYLMNGIVLGCRIIHGSTNNLLLYLNDGVDDYYKYGSSAGLLDGLGWKHVAFVFRNSDAYIKIYVDGVDRTGTGPTGGATPEPEDLQSTWYIGEDVEGSLDDVIVFDRALEQWEVQEIFNQGEFKYLSKDLTVLRTLQELGASGANLTQTIAFDKTFLRTLEELGAEGANLTANVTKQLTSIREFTELGGEGANLTATYTDVRGAIYRTLEEFGASGVNLTATYEQTRVVLRELTELLHIQKKDILLEDGTDWTDPSEWSLNSGIVWDAGEGALKITNYHNTHLQNADLPIDTQKHYYIEYDIKVESKVVGQVLYAGTHSYAVLDGSWLPGHPGSYDYFGDSSSQFTEGIWYNRLNAGISGVPRTAETDATTYDTWHTGTKYATIMFLFNYSSGSSGQETYLRNLKFWEVEPVGTLWTVKRAYDELGANGANLISTFTKTSIYPRILSELGGEGANLTASLTKVNDYYEALSELGGEGANLTATYADVRGAIYRTLEELGDGINLGNVLLRDSDRMRDFYEPLYLNQTLAEADSLLFTKIFNRILEDSDITLTDLQINDISKIIVDDSIINLTQVFERVTTVGRTLEEAGINGINLDDTLTSVVVFLRILEEFNDNSLSLDDSIIRDFDAQRIFSELGAAGINLTDTYVQDTVAFIEETITLTDTILKDLSIPLSETADLIYSILKDMALPLSELADAINLDDTLTKVSVYPRTLQELGAAGINLDDTYIQDTVTSFTETATLTDIILKDLSIPLTEISTLISSILNDMSITLSELEVEGANLTDTYTKVAIYPRTLSELGAEGANLTQFFTIQRVILRELTQTGINALSVDDTFAKDTTWGRILIEDNTDGVNLTPTFTMLNLINRTLEEVGGNALSLDDTIEFFTVKVIENVINLIQTITRLEIFNRILEELDAEGINLGATLLRDSDRLRDMQETITLNLDLTDAETLTFLKVFNRVLEDSDITLGDFWINDISKIIVDDTGISLIQVLERIITIERILEEAGINAVGLDDVYSRLRTVFRTLEEDNNLDDEFVRSVSWERVAEELAGEGINLTQTFTILNTFFRTLDEQAWSLDDTIIKDIFRPIIDDSGINLEETQQKSVFIIPDETVTLIDTYIRTIGEDYLENTTLTDTILKALNRSLIETIILIYDLERVNVWGVVIEEFGAEGINLIQNLEKDWTIIREFAELGINGINLIDIQTAIRVYLIELYELGINGINLTGTWERGIMAWTRVFFNQLSLEAENQDDEMLLDVFKNVENEVTLVDTILRDNTIAPFEETLSLIDTYIRNIGQNPVETVSLTDSYIRNILKAQAETITLNDTLLRVLGWMFIESVTLGDSYTRDISRTPIELVTLTDTYTLAIAEDYLENVTLIDTILKALNKNILETIILTGTYIRSITRNISEVATLTDTYTLAIAEDYLESITLTDTFLRILDWSLIETITLTDTYIRDISRSISEVATLTDTVLKDSTLIKLMTEIASLSDSLIEIFIGDRTLTESTSLIDSYIRDIYRVPVEVITLDDTYLRGITESYVESVTIDDTFLMDVAWIRTPIEIINLGALLLRDSDRIRDMVEGITLTDTYTDLRGVIYRILSDVGTLTDDTFVDISRTPTDTIILDDTFIRNIFRTITNTATLTDDIIKATDRIVLNTLNINDLVTKEPTKDLDVMVMFLGDILIKAGLHDLMQTLVLVDTVTKDTDHIITNVMSLTDVFEDILSSYNTLSEIVSLVDIEENSIGRTLTTAISLGDTFEKAATQYRIASEDITLVDTYIRDILKAPVETTILTDSYIRDMFKIPVETITLTDIQLNTLEWMFTESLTLVSSRYVDVSKVVSELMDINDTAVSLQLVFIIILEGLTLTTDVLELRFTVARELLESMTLSDTITSGIGTMLSDSISLADSISNYALFKVIAATIVLMLETKSSVIEVLNKRGIIDTARKTVLEMLRKKVVIIRDEG